MNQKRFKLAVLFMAAFVIIIGLAMAGDEKAEHAMTQPAHVMITDAELKWTDGPKSLPAGAKMAVLEGDPAAAGLFTLRFKLPADYKVPAHWHPADEHVTVLAGSFSMGLGEKFDEKALKELPLAGFAVMPTGVRHFAWSKDGATIQLHGMGPWGINYVNAADDPRQTTTSEK